ncbi:MAG: calcium-binding protein [Bacteroidaceae bacterium]|nr:calcium-binding protein [Bacteroidaceae bacterium]
MSDNVVTREHIVRGLFYEWMQKGLDLVESSYGLSFNHGNVSVNEMPVHFATNLDNENFTAQIRWQDNDHDGRVNSLDMDINMKYWGDIDMTDPNGYAKKGGWLDRTVAHELTHAVMAANIEWFQFMPKFIKEGAAELVHGVDDKRNLKGLTVSDFEAMRLDRIYEAVLNGSDGNDYEAYGGGFVWFRCLAHFSGNWNKTGQQTIKDFMYSLATQEHQTAHNQAEAASIALCRLNRAIRDATNGQAENIDTVTNTLISAIKNDANYLRNCCGINLENTDTGAITGQDAGGSQTPKTAQSIVPEDTATSQWGSIYKSGDSPDIVGHRTVNVYNGLRVVWPAEYIGSRIQNDQGEVKVGSSMGIDTLIGGSGMSSLWGGGAAPDIMKHGQSSQVSFWFGTGDGKDTVEGFQGGSGAGKDAIHFFDGLQFSSFVNDGSSTVITLSDSSDQLKLSGFGGTTPQTMRFTMDDRNYGGLQLGKTGAANTFSYTGDETNFYFGSTGKDTLKIASGVSANIWLDGGAGKNYSHMDVIDGSATSGELLIAGVDNNETIIGGKGSNTLYGGSGSSNDVLMGQGRSDYWYGRGDGNDIVKNTNSSDKVVFYNATLSDLSSAGMVGSNMVLKANDGGTLTIENYTASSVNQFQFGDGSSWTYDYNSRTWKLN